ncbi:MAG: 2-dehydropantoate 2-reductase [Acetatifactor sp.]|nr:2-dehydropantoate 2-reductase [Acetatifactor sp.]
MKIALVGPGAMGLLFGGYLSQKHDVTLIGKDAEIMDQIEKEGVRIQETDGREQVYRPHATAEPDKLEAADLVLLFVKAGDSRKALESVKHLIGEGTFLMTLQNGAGHEKLLTQYAPQERVIIGTTNQGSYKLDAISVCHSGLGDTFLGAVSGSAGHFASVAEAFQESGISCSLSDQVKGLIWNKLMINASSSVLSGILQMPQGYIVGDEAAWSMARKLIREICAVATADGYPFDAEEQIERIQGHLQDAPGGYTSIYADLKAGRRTEVSVINGAVVEDGHRLGIPVPTHEFIVEMVHAMEGRN